jgi:hypothetical protein
MTKRWRKGKCYHEYLFENEWLFGGIARVTWEHLSTDKIIFSGLANFWYFPKKFLVIWKIHEKFNWKPKSPNMNTKDISMKYVKLLLWILMIPISMQNRDLYQLIFSQTKIQLSNTNIYGMEKELWNCVTLFSMESFLGLSEWVLLRN